MFRMRRVVAPLCFLHLQFNLLWSPLVREGVRVLAIIHEEILLLRVLSNVILNGVIIVISPTMFALYAGSFMVGLSQTEGEVEAVVVVEEVGPRLTYLIVQNLPISLPSHRQLLVVFLAVLVALIWRL